MWTKFDVATPPRRWCLVRFKSLRVVDPLATARDGTVPDGSNIGQIADRISEDRDYAVLARWSERGHCFINQDLMGIPRSYREVDSYIEMPFGKITEVFEALGRRPEP